MLLDNGLCTIEYRSYVIPRIRSALPVCIYSVIFLKFGLGMSLYSQSYKSVLLRHIKQKLLNCYYLLIPYLQSPPGVSLSVPRPLLLVLLVPSEWGGVCYRGTRTTAQSASPRSPKGVSAWVCTMWLSDSVLSVNVTIASNPPQTKGPVLYRGGRTSENQISESLL